MRRISHGLSKRLIVLAALLSLALTLLFSGVASASTTTAPKTVLPPICISATPLSQVVGVKQTAWVTVSVGCPPTSLLSYVEVKWGDGIIEDYPILGCMEVCHIPPYIVKTSHAYTRVGIYNPVYCVVPSPLSVVARCTTTRITVVMLDPPVA